MRKWLCILIGCWCALCTSAQYSTTIHDANVRTLSMRYAGASAMPERPCLELVDGCVDGSDENNTLTIGFDEMSHDLRQYSYTILHLNHDWTESGISSYEYVQGFTTADIIDYEQSVNTQQAYTHYWLDFPNEDMKLLASGNYVLLIYEDGDMDNKVAQVCFSVVEPMVGIDAKVRANTDVELNGRYQQLDIDVQTAALNMRSTDEVKVVVRQNNRLDNQVLLTRPTFVEPNRLRYINQKALIFEGGNEFRRFDSYSTYYAGYHVDVVRYARGEYHALLEEDEVRGTMARGAGREGSVYLTEPDANGQWVVNCEKSEYVDTDAEYMWVHFVLPVAQPLMDKHVFVGGDLSYNHFSADNLMAYDAENKCYRTALYLKQGGYDYMYYTVDAAGSASCLLLEGSHWQTENEYTIMVYYRPFGGRYDRLVGRCVKK